MRIPFAFMRAPDAGSPPAPLEYPSGLKGINLSGGSDLDEWWSFPSTTAIDYYYAQGFNFFRIPFRWERLQHAVGGALDATHLADLDAAVQYALGKGADVRVMLVAHNFGGRYETGGNGALPIGGEPEQKIGGALVGGFQVTRAHFADFWARVATYYADEPRVVFDLMNEPESMPADGYGDGTMQLVAAYNDAIAAIRSAETETHLIALEGHGWNNAQSFSDDWYGTENSVAFLSIVDSADYWVASVHDYPDVDHGDEGDAVSGTALSDRIANVLTWAAANDRKVMVGEFATHTADPLGDDVITDFLDTIGADAHVVGWAWWEGRSSADTSSGYNIPWDSEEGDDAKLAWLAPYLSGAAPVLTSLDYTQGDTLGGGQPIVLTGSGFTGATDVLFGATSAAFVVDSDTQITATLPAHAAAVVDVTVTGPGGSDALTLAFEFWDPSQLPALQEFLDTSVGLTADGSGLVTGWTSRAGASAGTWVVAGGVPAPSKVADAFGPGIPALRIDSSLKGIRRSAAYTFNSSDKSVFYVGKWTSTDTAATYPLINPPLTAIGWSGWTGLGASGGEAMFVSYNSPGNTSGEIQGGAGLNDGGPHLVGVTNPPAGITDLYADNAVVASSASGAFSFYGIERIGANAGDDDGLVGDLGAFIVLASSAGGSGIPSTSDRNKLYAWARQRFGGA